MSTSNNNSSSSSSSGGGGGNNDDKPNSSSTIKPKKKNIFQRVSNKVSSKLSTVFHKVENKFQTKVTEVALSALLGKNEKAMLSLIFEIMAKVPSSSTSSPGTNMNDVSKRTRRYVIRYVNVCHDLISNNKINEENDKINAITESVAVLVQYLLKELKEPQYVRDEEGISSLITDCYNAIQNLTKAYTTNDDMKLLDYIHSNLSNTEYTRFFLSSPVVETERAQFLASLEEYNMPNNNQTTERSDIYIKKIKERHDLLSLLVKKPELIFKKAMQRHATSLSFLKDWIIANGTARDNNIIRFHLSVEDYKSISSLHLFASRANIIYNTYLDIADKDSDIYIELNPSILDNINRSMDNGVFTRRLFQEAQLSLLLEIESIFSKGLLTSPQFKNLESEYQELGARLIFLTRDITDIDGDDDDDDSNNNNNDNTSVSTITNDMKTLDLTRQSVINRSTIADFF